MDNKDLSYFESLPLTILSSYGHNGLDWVHSLLDSHPEIILMPAFSFYRTLDFFSIENGCSFDELDDNELIDKLSTFLFKDKSYQVVRRKFLNSEEEMLVFRENLLYFMENSSISLRIKKLFYGIHFSFCHVVDKDVKTFKIIVHQEHVSWHSLGYEKHFNPSFIFVMRDPRAGLAGAWKRQSENAGLERLNPFDFDKTILAGRYLEAFQSRKSRDQYKSKTIIMVNEKMHDDLESEMRKLCSWLKIKYQESCLNETFLGKEWLGESSYLGVDELDERPPANFYDRDKIETRWRSRLNKDEINMIETVFKNTFKVYEYKRDFRENYFNHLKGILKFLTISLYNQDESPSIRRHLKTIRNFLRRLTLLINPLITAKLFFNTMKNKILVTGVAGFIGFHLAKKLLERGDTVVGIDNLNSYYDVQIKKARLNILKDYSASNGKYFNFRKIDLSNASELNNLFTQENFDKVINLAAQAGVRYSIENPHAYVESNLIGFTNILEACRHNKIKHLTYASTSSVYGANTDLPFKETKEASNPLQFYAATKKANELMAHSYSNLFGLPTSGLRFFTVYGPWGRPDMALFLFTHNIINNMPIKVFNNGKHSRDFTYVDDIVKGVIKVSDIPPENDPNWNRHDSNSASSSAPYRVLNIGNNNPVKLETFIKEIEKNLQKKAIKEYLPLQDGDVPETYADTSLLHELTGYIPETTIEEGVRKFIAWYISYHNIK